MKGLIAGFAVAYLALAVVGLALGFHPGAILAVGPAAAVAFAIGYLLDILVFVLIVGAIVRWRRRRALKRRAAATPAEIPRAS